MSKHRNLDRGDVFPASWTDGLQEFISTLAANCDLSLASASSVQVVASTADGQVALGIGGLWRYRTTTATAAASGVAGVKDIFAVASANSFSNSPAPDTDLTDYNFYLVVLATGTTPTGNTSGGFPITAYRKIGELDWDGTSIISNLRQTEGSQNAMQTINPRSTQPGLVPFAVRGAAAQTAALIAAGSSASASDRFVLSAAGQAQLPVVGSAGGVLVGGDAAVYRKAAATVGVTNFVDATSGYLVNGVALAAANLSNGVTGTGAVALAVSPALTGTPTATTAANGTNTTQVATTAFVASAFGTGANSVLGALTTVSTLAGNGLANTVTLAGATTTNPVTLTAGGSDTNVGISLVPKGSGAVIAPTAAVGTNTTQVATTAFVLGQAGTLPPVMSGAATVGVDSRYSRQDHVHPIDTSRAALASPALTGTPTAPTAANGTNTTQLATTAFVAAAFGTGANSTLGTVTTVSTLAGNGLANTITLAGAATLNPATLTAGGSDANVGISLVPKGSGTVIAPTAAVDTNTTQLATTAFVAGQAAAASPAMDGTVAVGTSLRYARADHIHPTDTSRAPLASPVLTGVPAGPTATIDTNTTQVATTAFVLAQAAAAAPVMDGVVAVGTSTRFARADHVHATDTSRAPLASPALTGVPIAPTAAAGTNTTQLATTAFVATAITGVTAGSFASLSLSGTGKSTLAFPDTTTTTGFTIGADTNLYRAQANTLQTDDNLWVGLQLVPRNMFVSAYAGNAIETTQIASQPVLVNRLLAADSGAAFVAFGDGRQEWGPGGSAARDVNLYRAAADTLGTDDRFQVVRPLTSDTAYAVRVGVEASYRLAITGLGSHAWSDGTNAADTNLYRASADVLKTDDAFQALSVQTPNNLGQKLVMYDSGVGQRYGVGIQTAETSIYAGSSGTVGFRVGDVDGPRYFYVTAVNGNLCWGPSSAAADVILRRDSVGVLGVRNGADTAYAPINASAYQVAGTALQASNLSNGVTGSGAVALAASPTLTGTATVANLTSTGNVLVGGAAATLGFFKASGGVAKITGHGTTAALGTGRAVTLGAGSSLNDVISALSGLVVDLKSYGLIG